MVALPPQGNPRIAEIHLRLVDETDARRRAALHLELAAIAAREGKLDAARRHLREALHFDQTLDRARAELHALAARADGAERPKRGWWRGVFRRS